MDRPALFIECDLGFGDAGKGTVSDFLCRAFNIKHVVRFNGGPQAGHNVVLPDGRHHCYSSFSAATFVDGVRTIVSRKMLIKPDNAINEGKTLRQKAVPDAFARLTIDRHSAIITPYHQMICQMLETVRYDNRFGTCGLGVGQTAQDEEQGLAIYPEDAANLSELEKKLDELRRQKMDLGKEIVTRSYSHQANSILLYFLKEYSTKKLLRLYCDFTERRGIAFCDVDELLRRLTFSGTPLLFEGAQGALLDKDNGFQPHITKSRTTFHNVNILLGQRIDQRPLRQKYDIQKIGILRPFGHRHGAGPFVTEDSRLRRQFSDPHNPTRIWEGDFRVGWLDLVALRYGIRLNDGVDWLGLTNLDKLTGLPKIRVCVSYEFRGALEPAVLNAFCEWEPLSKSRAKITAIKKARFNRSTLELTKILKNCRPLDFIDFPGWAVDISGSTEYDDLPPALKQFIGLLESADGLNVPVKLISVNPTYLGKFFIK
jgi:adenylosuccinate synthase